MNVVLILVLALCGLAMFIVKSKETKIVILFGSMVCLINVNFPIRIPLFQNSTEFLSLCFFLSEMKRIKNIISALKGTFVFKLLLLAFIGVIIAWLNSPNFDGIKGLFSMIKIEFLGKYFLLAIAIYSIKDELSVAKLIKPMFFCICILFLFAVLNIVLRHNYFVDWILKTSRDVSFVYADGGSKYALTDRFRVSSMFLNAFNYGYTCMVMCLLFMYFKNEFQIAKSMFYMAEFFSIFGIISCGCRTMMVCSILGCLIFCVIHYKIGKIFKAGIFSLVLFIFAMQIFPQINDYVSNIYSVFDSKSQIKGSSIEMREIQMASTFYWIKDDIAFGRGDAFFSVDLGFNSDDKRNMVDGDLQGLENVTLHYLLERGIVGTLIFYVIYLSILNFFLLNRKYAKQEADVGITLIIVFLTFGNMTGILLSYFTTLLLSGILIKIIYSKKNEKGICCCCNV